MFQPKTKIVQHGDLILTLSEATNALGQKRFELIQAGSDANRKELEAAGDKGFANPYRAYYRVNIYPPIVACVVSATEKGQPINWPPPFDEFFGNWSEALTEEMAAASRELNPHWWPRPEAEAETPKVEPTEPTESSAG